MDKVGAHTVVYASTGKVKVDRELKRQQRRRRGQRLVKNKFIFYQQNSRLSRSVQFANGSKNALRLNMR